MNGRFVLTCALALMGATGFATEPAAPPRLEESPHLAALVAQGKLPPVAQRVGEEPLVIHPGTYGIHEAGVYGGTWREDAADAPNVQGATDITLPLFLDDAGKLWPLGWKSYIASEDRRIWTFHLRRGMKWSDGHPYTADDVQFWYEDVALNTELNPTPPNWITSDGQPAKLAVIDEYSVEFTFAKPYLSFDYALASSGERQVMACPKHYLKQFHPKYNSKEELVARVRSKGMQLWQQLWQAQFDANYQRNSDLPTLCPWMVRVGVPQNPVTYERNPYYWAIDASGRQLPYIDEYCVNVVGNPERMKLRALSGDASHAVLPLDSAEIARRAEKRGRIGIGLVPFPKDINSNTLTFNRLTPDPFKARLLNDKRFRAAMSLQMPRNVISQILDNGLTRPKQIGVSDPKHRWFNPALAGAYLEYDVDAANRLLDEMGLVTRNSDGLRLDPDGNPITFSVVTVNGAALQTTAEIFIEYLPKVGLQGNLRIIGWDGLSDTLNEARWELFIWQDLAGSPMVWPQGMEGLRPSIWNGAQWQRWLDSGGKSGVEPPTPMRQAWLHWMAAKSAASDAELDTSLQRLQTLAADELPAVGINSFPPVLRITDGSIQNVPLRKWYYLRSAAFYREGGK